MGLFSAKKKIYVSSTCYNMAGDEADRPDYLKSVVVGAAITRPAGTSLTEVIRDSYINGPGAKLKGYYRWSEKSYQSEIGFSSTGIAAAPDISPGLVAAYITPSAGKTISVQSVHVGPADLEVWAQQWMLENAYTDFNSDWTADYDEATSQIVITLPGGSVHRFTPANFSKSATYISATYNEVTEGAYMPAVAGSVVTLASGAALPSTTGWETEKYETTSYTTPQAWTETHGVYTKTVMETDPETEVVYRVRYRMYQDQVGQVDGAGQLTITRSHKTNVSRTVVVAYSLLRIFIYRVGSGIPALDDQVTDTSDTVNGFFPPIPVRVDNHFLSESHLPEQYASAKAAYKKLVSGSKFDELITNLSDNPNLGDIDYIYVVPGVSLNVQENACRKYLYNFFAGVMANALYGEGDYTYWGTANGTNKEAMSLWRDWIDNQATITDPSQSTPEPARGYSTSAAVNEIRTSTSTAGLSYDTRISWNSISEESGTGLSRPGAKPGDVWLASGDSIFTPGSVSGGMLGVLDGADSSDLLIYWQLSEISWKRLVIRGLVHRNYIYGGKYVEIGAKEALEDVEDSGFIVPIHYDTFRSMSVRDCSQMSTACVFLVINSYQIVKQKWYQTGLFKLIVIIAIVVLTILCPPAGLAGASVFTIVTVTLTNILISMILFQITQKVMVELFGRKAGTIITIIATFLTLNPEMIGQSLSQNLAYLAQAENLISLTNAISQTISAIGTFKVENIMAKNQGVLDEYEKASKQIADLYAKNLGGDFSFDPAAFTGASNAGSFVVEPSSVFLARTLMTGSDIAELSMSMVSDFTSLTLNTELPV